MDRLLTGLQPSGSLTIGNYAGGISQIVNYQKDYAVAWNTHSHSEPIKRLIDFIDNNL